MRIHSGKRIFKSNICKMTCIHKSHLNHHEKLNSGEKPYECQTYKMKFYDKSNLNVHLNIHLPIEKKKSLNVEFVIRDFLKDHTSCFLLEYIILKRNHMYVLLVERLI